jgi:hypothetical protein
VTLVSIGDQAHRSVGRLAKNPSALLDESAAAAMLQDTEAVPANSLLP